MRTRSSIMWIVALTGPSSTISRQMSAMNRPSDVPPVHESSGVIPATSRDRRRDGRDERPRRRQEGLAGAGPVDRVVEAMPVEDRREALAQRLRGALGRVPEIELQRQRAGNDVGRARPRLDVRALPRRGREIRVAVVPPRRGELGDRRGDEMDGIAREVRIRDVALLPLDRQRAREAAAAPVLDHVAQPVHRGRLADDAVIDRLARGGQPFDDAHGAVDAGPFLVGGQQQRDRARRIGVRGEERLDRDDEGRQRALHVGGAAAVQPAVALGRDERVGAPLIERPRGDDVGVPGEGEQRAAAAAPRPEVGDAVAGERLAAEAERLEARRDQRLAAGVVGRERAPGDERAREFQRRERRRANGHVHAGRAARGAAPAAAAVSGRGRACPVRSAST